VVVPSVVEKEGVEDDAALLVQLAAESFDHGQRRGLVEGGEVAEVVPGVVVEKRRVRTGPLPLDVREEVAPELPVPRGADDARVLDGLTRSERELARESRARPPAGGRDGQRMLESEKPRAGRERRSGDRSADRGGRHLEVHERDLSKRQVRFRRQGDLLPEVSGVRAQDRTPDGAKAPRIVGQLERDPASGPTTRRGRRGTGGQLGQLFYRRRPRRAQVGRVEELSPVETQREGAAGARESPAVAAVFDPKEARARRARRPLRPDRSVVQNESVAFDGGAHRFRGGGGRRTERDAGGGDPGERGGLPDEVAARRPARLSHAAILTVRSAATEEVP
jgi:hypothetical protein